MKVVLAMSTSLNALVARENGEEDWLPSEGWDEFLVEAKKFDNFIMGRETYELVTKLYPNYNFDNVTASKKIIVTTNKDFKAQRNGYEIAHSPEEALALLVNAGVETALLIGGGKLNTEFLTRNLVDEIWLTVNPIILGQGRPFIAPKDFEKTLKLEAVEQIVKDRVLLKYSVTK